MGSKLNLKEYADYKGYSIYKIEKLAQLSHGILKVGEHFRADQLKTIRDSFPDLNMDWLIYNEGNMLLETPIVGVMDTEIEYNKRCKNCEYLENELAHAKNLIEAKDDTISTLKELAEVKKVKPVKSGI